VQVIRITGNEYPVVVALLVSSIIPKKAILSLQQIMQNKANFPEAQMNASSIITKDYERIGTCGVHKSKANQSQFLLRTDR
jgi:hypothetical protein